MLDDFMTRAFIAGLGLALVCAPLGCFVVWRRMAYFGDATAHAAMLGVALSLAVQTDVFYGALIFKTTYIPKKTLQFFTLLTLSSSSI